MDKAPDARDVRRMVAADEGAEEFLLEPDGRLMTTGSDRRGLPAVPPALLEAVVLARPVQLAAVDWRARMLDWLGERGTIDR
jgi:hypothetical protein